MAPRLPSIQKERSSGENETSAIHLLDLTRKQKIAFLNSFDEVLVNCDGENYKKSTKYCEHFGVIWMFWGPIPNACYGVILFKRMGKPVRFLSNNSMRSDDEHILKFKTLGIEGVKPQDIIIPVKTMVGYLKRILPGKPVFSLCGPAVNAILLRNGIKIRTMKPILDLTLENLAQKMALEDKVGAVLMDVNFNLSISELVRAQQYLEDPECALIVGANNNIIPLTETLKTIGPGGFVNLLKESSGKDPVLLGKGTVLNTEIMEQFHIKKPSRYLFIGESVDPDILFANRCGFQSLLVLTGAGTLEEVKKMRPQEKPDYILDKLSDFVEFMADLN